MTSDLSRKLKENTLVMVDTFTRNNLKILNYSFRFSGEEEEYCELIVELQTITGEKIYDDFCLKVNIYDSNGDILLSEGNFLFANSFLGYDTFKIDLDNESQIMNEAKSARIFLAK